LSPNQQKLPVPALRSAQDDDSVGGLTKNILNKLALMRRNPG
jgi:hypothetical protein